MSVSSLQTCPGRIHNVLRANLQRHSLVAISQQLRQQFLQNLPKHIAEPSPDDRGFFSGYYSMSRSAFSDLQVLSEDIHAQLLQTARNRCSDDATRHELKISTDLWDVIKRSEARKEVPVIGRLDWALQDYNAETGEFTPQLLEYNADNPGVILQSTYGQRAFEDVLLPCAVNGVKGRTTGWQLQSALTTAIKRIFANAKDISILHHYGDPELIRLASCIHALCQGAMPGTSIHRVVFPAVPLNTATKATKTSHTTQQIMNLDMNIIKLYRWSAIMGPEYGNNKSRFPPIKEYLQLWMGNQAENTAKNILEPAISSLLNHKGLLVYLSHAIGRHPNIPLTTFEMEAGIPEYAQGVVHKPLTGVQSQGIRMLLPSVTSFEEESDKHLPEKLPLHAFQTYRERLPRGIFQQLIPAAKVPKASRGNNSSKDIYPILCTWVIEGRCAGMIVRESDWEVTRRDSALPVIIED